MRSNPPPRDYVYWTYCPDSVGWLIDEMTTDESQREVTYATMLRHADGMLEKAEELNYDRRSSQGLTLKDDWAVSFHRSFYCGAPCYYFVWSGMEFIWIRMGFEEEVQQFERAARAIDQASRDSRLLKHLPGSKAEGVSVCDRDIDWVQLRAGMVVELEHTSDIFLAMAIALDHLVEDKDYYIKLETIDPHHVRENPYDMGAYRANVKRVRLIDRQTGESIPMDGASAEEIVSLLDPVLVLSRDPLSYRKQFGIAPNLKKPSLVYSYQVEVEGKDGGIQTFSQVGIISETSKMICGSFSLPAGQPGDGGTCIISSEKKPQICADCYAKGHHYTYPSKIIASEAVKQWVVGVLSDKRGPEWLGELLAAAISDYQSKSHISKDSKIEMNPYYFRIHDSGDFGWYGPDYFKAWVIATELLPGVLFWAPTRDHHNKTMLRAYQTIKRPDNFIIRPSALRFQEPAPVIPGLDAGTCSAYVAEGLPDPMDLCDFDCPAYRGTGNCESEGCRVCWEQPTLSVNYTPHGTTSRTNIPLLRKKHGR